MVRLPSRAVAFSAAAGAAFRPSPELRHVVFGLFIVAVSSLDGRSVQAPQHDLVPSIISNVSPPQAQIESSADILRFLKEGTGKLRRNLRNSSWAEIQPQLVESGFTKTPRNLLVEESSTKAMQAIGRGHAWSIWLNKWRLEFPVGRLQGQRSTSGSFFAQFLVEPVPQNSGFAVVERDFEAVLGYSERPNATIPEILKGRTQTSVLVADIVRAVYAVKTPAHDETVIMVELYYDDFRKTWRWQLPPGFMIAVLLSLTERQAEHFDVEYFILSSSEAAKRPAEWAIHRIGGGAVASEAVSLFSRAAASQLSPRNEVLLLSQEGEGEHGGGSGLDVLKATIVSCRFRKVALSHALTSLAGLLEGASAIQCRVPEELDMEVSLTAEAVSLYDAVEVLCELAGVRWEVAGRVVTILEGD